MSRIGKKPVVIPSGVKVALGDNNVSVEGKAKLSIAIPPKVTIDVQDSQVIVNRIDDTRESGAMQGLARSLINNMVIGVTEGFKKELLVIGVGYRAQVKGKTLDLSLGYSHPINYRIPKVSKLLLKVIKLPSQVLINNKSVKRPLLFVVTENLSLTKARAFDMLMNI